MLGHQLILTSLSLADRKLSGTANVLGRLLNRLITHINCFLKRKMSMSEKTPKTLILVPDLNIIGGVSIYYKTLGLNSNNCFSYFIINTDKKQSFFSTVIRLIINYCRFFIKLIWKDYQQVVINPSLDRGKSFHRDLVFILISKALNKKTLVFFHGWLDSYEAQIKESIVKSLLFKISYARVDAYIVLGQVFKAKLLSLGVPSKTKFFIETTVVDSSHLKEIDLHQKHRSFLDVVQFVFLSRIEKEKGLFIALEAYLLFVRENPHLKSRFIVAGDGRDLSEAKKLVDEKGIPNIIFLGNVRGERKREILQESHILILPSYGEGMPISILEGMLYGMAVVARASGSLGEIIVQNANGFLTESYDPLVFSNFLSTIANNKKLFKSMSEANHKLASDKFTKEAVYERVIKILKSN